MAAPAVSFGQISNNIAAAGKLFTATIQLANAVSASIATAVPNLGSGWSISSLNDGITWKIIGYAPSYCSRFNLLITARNVDGTSNITQTVAITNTVNGTTSPSQNVVLTYGQVALWLDWSDPTTLNIDPTGNTAYAYDKVNGYGWKMRSSETISSDQTTFTVPGLAFSSVKYNSGFNTLIQIDPATCPALVAAAPFKGVPIADQNGYSTLMMVVAYTAPAIGVPDAGFYAIGEAAVPSGDFLLSGTWGVDTKNVGIYPLNLTFTDQETPTGANPYNQYLSDNFVPVNGKAVIVWRYGPSGVSIRMASIESSTRYQKRVYNGNNFTINSVQTNALQNGFTPATAIGMFGSISGYSIGSVGEIIALKGYLPDADTLALEQYLTNKWFASNSTPATITTNSEPSQYVNQVYTGIYVITNGNLHTTVAIIVSPDTMPGSLWKIEQLYPTDNTLWKVTGVMPSVASSFNLTIAAVTDNVASEQVFRLTSLAAPITPVIGTMVPFQGEIGLPFSGVLQIDHFTEASSNQLSIISSLGDTWTIARSPNDTTKFIVSGTMPTTAKIFTLLVTAINTVPNTALSSNAVKNVSLVAVDTSVYALPKIPLDVTGQALPNKIVNEQHTLSVENGAQRQMLVPTYGPFYGDGLVVSYSGPGMIRIVARPNIDYVPVYELVQLSKALSKPVFTGIGILNLSMIGTISIDYQTLGGDFVVNKNRLYFELADRLNNDRQTYWSQLVGLDKFFTVAPHQHHVEADLVGLTSVNNAVNSLSANVQNTASDQDSIDIVNHLTIIGNPHNTTKAKIGLGNVDNFPPATTLQAVDPTNTTTFLTPYSATLSASRNVNMASTNLYGIVSLNLGNTPGDDNNALDGLTAAGLVTMLTAPTSNFIQSAFAGGQQFAKVKPSVPQLPLWWRGVKYSTLDSFITAVQTIADIYPLQYYADTGTFVFPEGAIVPDLTVVFTQPTTSMRYSTVYDPITYPLKIFT